METITIGGIDCHRTDLRTGSIALPPAPGSIRAREAPWTYTPPLAPRVSSPSERTAEVEFVEVEGVQEHERGAPRGLSQQEWLVQRHTGDVDPIYLSDASLAAHVAGLRAQVDRNAVNIRAARAEAQAELEAQNAELLADMEAAAVALKPYASGLPLERSPGGLPALCASPVLLAGQIDRALVAMDDARRLISQRQPRPTPGQPSSLAHAYRAVITEQRRRAAERADLQREAESLRDKLALLGVQL